jgi:hypothetical protein
VNTAYNLARVTGPAQQRAGRDGPPRAAGRDQPAAGPAEGRTEQPLR